MIGWHQELDGIRKKSAHPRNDNGFPTSWYEPQMTASHFKGWAKPGPVPPGAGVQDSACSDNTPKRELQPEPHETLDAISGHFRLFQLARRPPFFHRRHFDGVVWHELVPDRAHRARPRQRHRHGRHDLRVAAARREICDGRGAKRKRGARPKIRALQWH